MKNIKSEKLPNAIATRAIRQGLTLAIPFLILGSFALLLRDFPNEAYQAFLTNYLQGAPATLLQTLFDISLGSLALILCLSISLSYGRLTETDAWVLYPFVALASYLAFCGGLWEKGEYIFSAEWVFTSMCVTLLSCYLFRRLAVLGQKFKKLHTMGAEYLFNLSLQTMPAIIIIVVLFAVIGLCLRSAWGNNVATNFGSFLFLQIFNKIGGNLLGILLYVLTTHVLWFFGIHGTNTLEAVSQKLFEHNIDVNQALLAAGQNPTEIFSKTFLDTFVFLGGCGSTLCLVIGLCIIAKKSHNRKLAYLAFPSVFFNISEIAVFGFPIIFNFTMLIPFLLTPLILTLISTLATVLGIVPPVIESVGWTVPIVLSGYQATGSIAGSVLQMVNLVVGVLIYLPFIKGSEKKQTREFQQAVHHMEKAMEKGEKDGIIPVFLHHKYPYSYYAKTLSVDLKNAMRCGQVDLFYQPQIRSDGSLHGAEALLRWKHPVVGYIAPPVLICLAYENGFLDELGLYLTQRACKDALVMEQEIQPPMHLSINISPTQLNSEYFLQQVMKIIKAHALDKVRPVLEITERSAIEFSDRLLQEMQTLQQNGIVFSMDDFGVGHTSLLSLQQNLFDEVKLDGQLIRQLTANERSRDIVAGLVQMSVPLHYRVVAEYVETKEQQELLQDLGCNIYQGYYYSRPLPLAEFLQYAGSLPAFSALKSQADISTHLS